MTLDEFKASLTDRLPPAGCGRALQALWYDAKGDWERAHSLAQEEATPFGARVHAYLHRKEGDLGNAAYWYAKAGCPAENRKPLADEWDSIVCMLLAK